MNQRAEQKFDDLVSQVHDWTESAVALDEGHFPNELLRELEDLVAELKDFLEDETEYDRQEVVEMFATPELTEVMDRFPKVRRLLERAWGPQFTDLLEEEGGFGRSDEDDEDDD
jgi:hypothetical protein